MFWEGPLQCSLHPKAPSCTKRSWFRMIYFRDRTWLRAYDPVEHLPPKLGLEYMCLGIRGEEASRMQKNSRSLMFDHWLVREVQEVQFSRSFDRRVGFCSILEMGRYSEGNTNSQQNRLLNWQTRQGEGHDCSNIYMKGGSWLRNFPSSKLTWQWKIHTLFLLHYQRVRIWWSHVVVKWKRKSPQTPNPAFSVRQPMKHSIWRAGVADWFWDVLGNMFWGMLEYMWMYRGSFSFRLLDEASQFTRQSECSFFISDSEGALLCPSSPGLKGAWKGTIQRYLAGTA